MTSDTTLRLMERVRREWFDVIERDSIHPCVVAWVPFNESWGVPNLPDNPAQRHYVQALYHLTTTLDPTRPVIGNDGWEAVATDIIGIRDYARLLAAVRNQPLLAGFCYTQFADTYQEANGLLYADRTPKFPLEEIAEATRGPHTARDRQIKWQWRERIMDLLRMQYYVPIADYRTQPDDKY